MRTKWYTGYVFILPAFLLLLLFSYIPILQNLYMSFTSWDMLIGDPEFVGLKNYVKILSDRSFWWSLWVTLKYALIFVPVSMSLGLGIALLLMGSGFFVSFLRTVFFSPTVTSMVAISAVWLYIFHPQYGTLNNLLGLVGIAPIAWLNDPNTSLYSLIILNVWKRMGFCSVIYLGALLNIPRDLYEAAEIDGADRMQKFRNITLPMISPATFMLIILLTIEVFQIFTQIDIMTQGGPDKATMTLLASMYYTAFTEFRMNEGSTLSIILLCIVLFINYLQMKFERCVNYED